MSRDTLIKIAYEVGDLSFNELLELYNMMEDLIQYKQKLDEIMIPIKEIKNESK